MKSAMHDFIECERRYGFMNGIQRLPPIQSRTENYVEVIMRPFTLLLVISILTLIGVTRAEGGTQTFNIMAAEDDATASPGSVGYLQSNMYVPYTDNTRLAFWRWQVSIPKGATITSAYMYIKSYGTAGDGNPTTAILKLVDMDSCPTFSDNATYGLPVTSASVPWSVPGVWRTDGGSNSDGWYKSPDIAPLVREFVLRSGYDYGSYLGIRAANGGGSWKSAYQWSSGASTGATLEVNYTGGEAIIDVLMADPEVRIAQKIHSRLINIYSTDKLVAYLDGIKVFEKIGNLQNEEVFTARYSSLAAGNHQLDIKVLDSGNNVRGSFNRTWRTLHNGIPKVGIDENNAICINGVPFFPITPFMMDFSRFSNWPSPSPNDFGSTINSLFGSGYNVNGQTISTAKLYMDQGASRGWYSVMPLRWQGFNDTNGNLSSIDNLVNYVNELKNYSPYLLAYTWVDEPEGDKNVSAITLRAWTEATHRNDTNHPVLVNSVGYYFTPGFGEPANNKIKTYSYLYNANQFSGKRTMVVDIYEIDYYSYEYGNNPLKPWINFEDYLLALDTVTGWNYNLIPVMTYIESQDLHDFYSIGHPSSCGWKISGNPPWTPDPTPAQLRNLIWASIIHGAKGISYFQYFCPIPDANIQVMKTVKEQVTALTPVILGPESAISINKAVNSGGRVDTLVKEYGGKPYIFAANIKSRNEYVRFDVPGLMAGENIYVYGENRNIIASNGYFQDNFGPLDVHIYVVRGTGIVEKILRFPNITNVQ